MNKGLKAKLHGAKLIGFSLFNEMKSLRPAKAWNFNMSKLSSAYMHRGIGYLLGNQKIVLIGRELMKE